MNNAIQERECLESSFQDLSVNRSDKVRKIDDMR